MVRIAFALGLLGLLAFGFSPAAAHPKATTWWFWLSKPERHGSRKLAGDFRPNYASYRNHSREHRGLFSFLHFSRRRHEALSRRRASKTRSASPHRSRMTL